jgi:hypothetical protein
VGYDGKLIIFTPFYKEQTIAPYATSLLVTGLVLDRIGIKFDYWPGCGGFTVERTLNSALTRFALESDATDFLNIDSDHGWNAADVVKIINYPEAIVSASYKMHNRFAKYTGVLKADEDGSYLGRYTSPNSALLQAIRVPAGFLRLKKEVVVKYIEAYPDDYFIFEDEKIYRFFWTTTRDHQYSTMDYGFSDKMRDIGFEIFIDPNIAIDHWCITKHSGNLDKYLRANKDLKQAKETLQDVGIWAVQDNGRV